MWRMIACCTVSLLIYSKKKKIFDAFSWLFHKEYKRYISVFPTFRKRSIGNFFLGKRCVSNFYLGTSYLKKIIVFIVFFQKWKKRFLETLETLKIVFKVFCLEPVSCNILKTISLKRFLII